MSGQFYENYTLEQFEVWSILYRRQLERLRGRVYARYYDDLEQLGFSAGELPRFSSMSPQLQALTGWRLEAVADFLEPAEYLGFTARCVLPATTFMRTMSELDHCRRPDMFHDVFGHTPLLVNPGYRAYLGLLSELAVSRVGDEEVIYKIANFNKWVTEFGLIDELGDIKAFGAGLLSSSGELEHALGDGARRLPAEVQTMVTTPHVRAEFQAQYFVIESFDSLVEKVHELSGLLDAAA